MKRTFYPVKYNSTQNVACHSANLRNVTKCYRRRRLSYLLLGIITLTSLLLFSPQQSHAKPGKPNFFTLGVEAYQNGWQPLSLSYLTPVCVSKTLSKPITQTQQAMACYLVAHTHLKQHRYQQGEAMLWRAITLAPVGSSVAQPASLAALALRHPKGWYQATGKTAPHYKAIAPTPPNDTDADALPTHGTGNDALTLPLSQGEDYLDDVMHAGQRLRWHPADSPLTLSVGKGSQQAKRFKQSYATEVNRAFGVWAKALDNRITVVPSNTPKTANIIVIFNDGLESNNSSSDKHGGITKPSIIDGQLTKMTITLRTVNPHTGAPLTNNQLFSIALHEAGHALGLMGHSSQPADVMHGASQASTLSSRDKRTIRRLYAEPAGVTSRPPSATDGTNATPSAGNTKALAAKETAVANAKKELNQSPNNWLRWQNYGGSLLSLAKAQKQANHGNLSPTVLNTLREADTAFTKVTELDATQATAHLYRAYTLEEMDNPRQAIQAVNKAIATDPTLADAYREKAWLYAGMNDDVKATIALNEYIRRNPDARGSQDVAQIERRIAE